MKKIVFICPYFGKLPNNQMTIWLKSCEKNEKVNWLILTDDKTEYSYPNNVKVIYTTLQQLKEDIQKKFDFTISLETAYKLCDFKPTYGYIFQDLIKEYDYWGHCDLSDSIFGDIEKNLSCILDKEYEKIGFLGHLTLYKNTKEVNERFFLPSKKNKSLMEILGEKNNMAFDEIYDYSINFVYLDNGYEIKRIDKLYFDISTRSHSFRQSFWSKKFKWLGLSKNSYIFEWNNGRLFKISIEKKQIYKEEILYVHYQKRKMKFQIDVKNTNHFYIVPNAFIELNLLDKNILKKYTKNQIINYTLLNIRINKVKKIVKGLKK